MKKQLKKIAILCVVLLFVVAPLAGIFFDLPATAAITSGNSGTCMWTLDGTKLTITGSGAMENYSFGSQPWGTDVTEVVIGEGVTSIGNYAFYGCSALTTVTVPNSVESIGKYAFGLCDSLKKVNISDVGAWCNINFGAKTANPLCCGAELFLNDALVSDLVIPESVTSIKDYAFEGCDFLNSVTIGENVTSVGYRSFYECTNLKSVVIGNKVATIGAYAFNNCDQLSEVAFGDSVASIRAYAFYDCDVLGAIALPASVTSIGDYAFSGCEGVEAITVEDGNAVYHSNGNCLINTADKALVYGCKNSVIPTDDSVTSICERAFQGCTGLSEVVISDNITSVGVYAFEGCSGLVTVVIGDGVEAISDYTFYNCEKLSSVTFGQNVTAIGKLAFSFCASLVSVDLPDSVITLGEYAFNNCKNLTAVDFGNSLTLIPKYCFYSCDALTVIDIPATVTSIEEFAFGSCDGVAEILVADGNPVYHAADNCLINTADKEIVLGCKASVIPTDETVISIGDYAFFECSGLASITIPDNITSIGKNAFESCIGLNYLELPASISSIGDYAFSSCNELENFVFYKGSINVGEAVFDGCTKLKAIWYEGDEEDRNQLSVHENNYEFNSDIWHYRACMINPAPEKEHDYDHACDTDCNRCGGIREITHDYEWIVDQEENCGYDGEKHEECTICHVTRNEHTAIPATGNHTYDNNCDEECNVCAMIRVPFDHVYDHACDADCNECGEVRPFEHAYSNNCDDSCNTVGCGFVREAPHDYDNGCDQSCNSCGFTRATFHKPVNGICSECGVKAARPVSAQLLMDRYISILLYFNKADIDSEFTYQVTLEGQDAPFVSGDYTDLKRSGNYSVLEIKGIGLEFFNTTFNIEGRTFWDPNVERYNSVVKLAELGVVSYESPRIKQLFKSIADLGRVYDNEAVSYDLHCFKEAPGSSGLAAEEGAAVTFTGKNLLMSDAIGLRLYGSCDSEDAVQGMKVTLDGAKDITDICEISELAFDAQTGKYTFTVDIYVSVSKMEEEMVILITDGDGKRCIELHDRVDWVAQKILSKEPDNALAEYVLIYIQSVKAYMGEDVLVKPSVPGEETELGGKLEI